jgi:hypothetical protein
MMSGAWRRISRLASVCMGRSDLWAALRTTRADFVIIGGGAAGCDSSHRFAADVRARRDGDLRRNRSHELARCLTFLS